MGILKVFILIVFFTHVAFSATCMDGYEQIENALSSTFMPIDYNYASGCSNNGYTSKDIPDDMYAIYDASLIGDEITLCSGGYLSNGECIQYDNGDVCGLDYKTPLTSSFMATNYNYASGCSNNGYTSKDIPDDMYAIYDASLIGNEITLCSGGYLSNGECVSYTRGDCPENYVDLSLPDNNVFARLNNATCSGVYKKFNIQECKEYPTDTMCGILCSNNLEYTELGTCAALCPGEHHTLKTSTGLSFPLYATKQITPSINIQMGENVCYVNLLSGESTNAINIEYNNKIYHTIK